MQRRERIFQSPTPVLKYILDLYRCLNSLEIDKLGAREDLCELGSSLVTEAANGEAVMRGQEVISSPWLGI